MRRRTIFKLLFCNFLRFFLTFYFKFLSLNYSFLLHLNDISIQDFKGILLDMDCTTKFDNLDQLIIEPVFTRTNLELCNWRSGRPHLVGGWSIWGRHGTFRKMKLFRAQTNICLIIDLVRFVSILIVVRLQLDVIVLHSYISLVGWLVGAKSSQFPHLIMLFCSMRKLKLLCAWIATNSI